MPKITAHNDNYNVLIADADGKFRSQLTLMLNKYEYNAIPASSGMHALSISEEQKIDFVIISKNLPDLSALETAGLFRAETLEAKSKTSPHVPIILLTPKYNDDEFAASEEFGINRYLLNNQITLATLPKLIKDLISTGKK